jgi:hypothetical protein
MSDRLGGIHWDFALLTIVEFVLYLSYQHHDAGFHWFLHFFVGTSAALVVLTILTYWFNRIIALPLLWLLGGHVIAMFPDFLWNLQVLPHQPWMDVFLLHVSAHFTPGRNWTWYVVFLISLAVYLVARCQMEMKSQSEFEPM